MLQKPTNKCKTCLYIRLSFLPKYDTVMMTVHRRDKDNVSLGANWNMDGSNMIFQNNIIFRNYHFIVFNGEGRVERGRGKLYTAFHPTHVIKCLSFCLDIFSKTKTFDIWDRYILRKRILQKDFHQVLCHSGKIIRRLAAVSILSLQTFHIGHLKRYVHKFSRLPQKLTCCERFGLQLLQNSEEFIFFTPERPF